MDSKGLESLRIFGLAILSLGVTFAVHLLVIVALAAFRKKGWLESGAYVNVSSEATVNYFLFAAVALGGNVVAWRKQRTRLNLALLVATGVSAGILLLGFGSGIFALAP